MLRNYLKITFAVLMRRKFLTFVNVFGAALTLTVLVVGYALFDSFVNPPGAQHRQSRILTFSDLMLDGRPVSFLLTSPGFKLYENYVAPLETPDRTSFTLQPFETSSYVGGRKITSHLRVTDAAYWDILDFELIDGRLGDIAHRQFEIIHPESFDSDTHPHLGFEPVTVGDRHAAHVAAETRHFEMP